MDGKTAQGLQNVQMDYVEERGGSGFVLKGAQGPSCSSSSCH
jgi:Fe-S cluster assembly iron-binding protein IscA